MLTAAEAISWIIQREPLKLTGWPSKLGPQFAAAGRELVKKAANKQLVAWGRLDQYGPLQRIPDSELRVTRLDLAVSPHGELSSYPPHKVLAYRDGGGRGWHDIEFDEDEIRKIWPEPLPIIAVNWMTSEAKKVKEETGHPNKRDDLVKRCMSAIGCTRRIAQAAHKELPPEYKRSRGKPTKSVG
jgi:hypothetical protein